MNLYKHINVYICCKGLVLHRSLIYKQKVTHLFNVFNGSPSSALIPVSGSTVVRTHLDEIKIHIGKYGVLSYADSAA